MRSFNFINEESHFSDYFIEIQSELEVVKSANRVKDEEENRLDKNFAERIKLVYKKCNCKKISLKI